MYRNHSCKSLRRIRVNFINIFRTRFLYKSKLSSFSIVTNPKHSFVILGAKILYKKAHLNVDEIDSNSLKSTLKGASISAHKFYKIELKSALACICPHFEIGLFKLIYVSVKQMHSETMPFGVIWKQKQYKLLQKFTTVHYFTNLQ